MLILPLKFIREEDKKTVGLNLYHLAKLGHLGLPVVESVVAVPPVQAFEKVMNKYLKHNLNIHDNLGNVRKELLALPLPDSLKSFELINLSPEKTKFTINTLKLWENLLEKWTLELISRISRNEKDIYKLTPQLVIFSANFTVMGRGFFDEDRGHAVIKTDKGHLDFKASSAIENLIIVGNKKLLLPQVYYWGVEDGNIKIVKVTPFTQSLHEGELNKVLSNGEKPEKIVSVQKNETGTILKTATKILINYVGEKIVTANIDGVVLNTRKLNADAINEEIEKINKSLPAPKIIFSPDFEPGYEKNLEYGREFLFFRNKKKIDAQIILPETFSVDEFLNLKREYAALGIYSKGSLKIWKQFNTVADFLNIEDYLESGFDGAVVNLDKIAKIVCGIDGELVLNEPTIDRITAIEKFFKELGLSKIIKSLKSVLLKGKLSQNEELLNYFIKSGVWGIAFENNVAGNYREHIAFLEKQALKKLPRIEIQH